LLFCRFFLFREEKKAAQKREAQERKEGCAHSIVLFLSSFGRTFSFRRKGAML
jgi:hypothetical protein